MSTSPTAGLAPAGWPDGEPGESPEYLSRQLITYLGNKRALLGPIESAVQRVRQRTGGGRLRILDAFAGSGVVSRMLRRHASELITNDIEDYAREVGECFMSNRAQVPTAELGRVVAELNREVAAAGPPPGFISELYAPADERDVRPGERVFYTPQNAYRLDAYRQLIEAEDPALRSLLLGPLLSAASVHANTAGVFKGFYKDRSTGLGRLGGSGADALSRITAPITLQAALLSRFECDYAVTQRDANGLARELAGLDVAYLDPPYNQHPYGSNYFMLNLLVNYRAPREISAVSGIPADWQRSDYNVRSRALPRLRELMDDLDARFIILSFSDDGFIAPGEMRQMLATLGHVSEDSRRTPPSAARGTCRAAARRSPSTST